MKIQIRLSNRRFVLLLLLGIWDYCKMIFLVRFQLLVSCWGQVPVLRSDLRKLLQWKDTKTGIPVFTINLVFIVQNICQEMNNNYIVLNIFCSQNIPNWDFVHMDTWNRTFNCNLFRWDLEYFLRSYIRFFFVHWKFSKKNLKIATHFILLNFSSLIGDLAFANPSSSKLTLVCFEVTFQWKWILSWKIMMNY